MKFIVLFLLLLAAPTASAGECKLDKEPKSGDVICWATGEKEANPVLGWHCYSKKLAAEAALNLCNKEYGNCTLKYCEVVR